RSSKDSFFKIGLSGNPLLAGMVLLVVALQLLVIYLPALSTFFDVRPLSALDLLIAIGAGALVFLAIEGEKILRKDKNTKLGTTSATSKPIRQL
ncbi:MAG TPA: cation transporting ATPase C-terminal domain-containing protein, partial [Anaerolineales bacterium]